MDFLWQAPVLIVSIFLYAYGGAAFIIWLMGGFDPQVRRDKEQSVLKKQQDDEARRQRIEEALR